MQQKIFLLFLKMKTIIPIKSATDAREYRYITLENGLRVTLVSDPHTVAAGLFFEFFYFKKNNSFLFFQHNE